MSETPEIDETQVPGQLSQDPPDALPQERLTDLLRDLDIGVVVVALADWRILFENGRFSSGARPMAMPMRRWMTVCPASSRSGRAIG